MWEMSACLDYAHTGAHTLSRAHTDWRAHTLSLSLSLSLSTVISAAVAVNKRGPGHGNCGVIIASDWAWVADMPLCHQTPGAKLILIAASNNFGQ